MPGACAYEFNQDVGAVFVDPEIVEVRASPPGCAIVSWRTETETGMAKAGLATTVEYRSRYAEYRASSYKPASRCELCDSDTVRYTFKCPHPCGKEITGRRSPSQLFI